MKFIKMVRNKVNSFLFPKWKLKIVLLHMSMTGLGDHLALTAITRYIRQHNPKAIIVVICPHPEFLERDPNIDILNKSLVDAPSTNPYRVHYSPKWFSWHKHMTRIMASCVDIKKIDNIQPNFEVFKEEQEWASKVINDLKSNGKVVIGMVRRYGPWTQNKEWPEERWQELVEVGKGKAVFLDLGLKDNDLNAGSHYTSFLGKTTVGQLAALLEKIDTLVTASSGPMHLAVARKCKVIMLSGPYEPPEFAAYDMCNVIANNPYGDQYCGVKEFHQECQDAMAKISAQLVWQTITKELKL